MKKHFSKLLKPLMGAMLLITLSTEPTYANPLFGSTKDYIGTQYVYGDVAVEVYHVKVYCFGILVNDYMMFKPIKEN